MAVLAVGLGAPAAVLVGVSCIPDLASQGGSDAGSLTDQIAADVAQPRCGDGVVQLTMGEQCDPGPTAGDAGANGCGADCRVQCDGGFAWVQGNHHNDHCYVDQALARDSIMVAANQCGAGAHLVTFASDEELAAVTGAIDAGAFWIGMEPYGTQAGYYALADFEPGWATTCPGCFAHTTDPTKPLPGPDGGCVRGFGDIHRSWDQVACSDLVAHHVICEREPAGRLSTVCEAGVCIDLVWTFGAKRYVYVREVALSDDAEQHCRGLGGTLVVLESRDEREQLWKELARPNVGAPKVIWIGLSVADGGSADAGPWVWDDDVAADAYPSPWGDRQPRGDFPRAYLYQNNGGPPLLLDDTLGHDEPLAAAPKYPYVCQLPP